MTNIKCTKCKRDSDVSKYMKKGKQLKTCDKCRDKGKQYREKKIKERQEQYMQTKVHINEPMPEPVEEIPCATEEEAYEMDKQEREYELNKTLDKLPHNKLYDNVRLIIKLLKTKYSDQKILYNIQVMEKKVHISIWYVTCKDKENINDCALLTVNESTTWKMVDKRIKKLLDGVPRECYICTETHDYNMCCETCPFSYCTDCYLEIKKTTGKHTCPSCRGASFTLGSYDIYYSSLDCLD